VAGVWVERSSRAAAVGLEHARDGHPALVADYHMHDRGDVGDEAAVRAARPSVAANHSTGELLQKLAQFVPGAMTLGITQLRFLCRD
jgi:hypothetical protein